MPTWFFDVKYPLGINLMSVVRKRKLGTQGNILRIEFHFQPFSVV
jgi:hypothetical protein